MKVAPEAAFGRHESFQLRYAWLSKGVKALLEDERVFSSQDATAKLGVGKNMVSSIRYWLQATSITDKNGQLSPFGEKLLGEDGFDRYLENDGTLWLLHYQLAKNCNYATTIYWLFNRFHKADFSADEAFAHIKVFVSEQGWKVAEKTLKTDLQTVLRMYAPRRSKRTQLEDALEFPLSLLGLLKYSEGKYHFMVSDRSDLPLEIMAFTLTDLMGEKKIIAVKDLMYGGNPSLGSIFKLTEESLVANLEKIAEKYQDYQLREDAGIFQMHKLNGIAPDQFLE